jgi:nucleotide-binding universal stress UspA family protein
MRRPAVRPLARSPGAVLTQVAVGDGDVLVLGREPGLNIRRLLHGSVSCYCRGHSRCAVIVVPTAPGRGHEAAGS